MDCRDDHWRFLLQLRGHYLHHRDVIGDALAFSPQAMAQHRYWTLLTYAWVHAIEFFGTPAFFWLHLASNLIPLVCLGPPLEAVLGQVRYLFLYLGGAIASALTWYLFNADPDPQQGIIGASGAVFAVIAGIGTVRPQTRVMVLIFFILPLRASMRVIALVICGGELVQAVFGWMPDVAHSAHLGGAFFGFIYVATLRYLAGKRHRVI